MSPGNSNNFFLFCSNYVALTVIDVLNWILWFVAEDSTSVKKTVAKKSHNLYYDARLLTSNYDNQQKPKKVYCYISPKVNAVKFFKFCWYFFIQVNRAIARIRWRGAKLVKLNFCYWGGGGGKRN